MEFEKLAPTKGTSVCRLEALCMDAVYLLLDKYSTISNPRSAGPLDKLAGELTEMLMERAYQTMKVWTTVWYLFLTPKIQRAYLPWDTKVWRLAKNKCRNLREVYVFTRNVKFKTMILDLLPAMLTTLDLHGDLFYRGRGLPHGYHNNWLTEAEAWLSFHVMQVANSGGISSETVLDMRPSIATIFFKCL